MSDKRKTPDDQHFFFETGDWSPKSEELAAQLCRDAERLASKYPAPPAADLAKRIASQLRSEETVTLQKVTIFDSEQQVRDEEQNTTIDNQSDGPATLHILDSEDDSSVEEFGKWDWLKIAAAALLLFSVTGSMMLHRMRRLDNSLESVEVAKENDARVNQDQVKNIAVDMKSDVASKAESSSGVSESDPSDPMNTEVFQSLSGPQQEAILDLLNEKNLPRVSISI